MATSRRRVLTTAERIERMEAKVLKIKKEYDEAIEALKKLREIELKENQEALLNAISKSKWSYEKIMEFITSDPNDMDE